MNKIFTILVVLVLFYRSIQPFLRFFTRKKERRREYKLTLSKQFNHLFSAVLLILIPLSILANYYTLIPDGGIMIVLILGAVSLLVASISFYLYFNYIRKTAYQSLIYDPEKLSLELIKDNKRVLILFKSISGIKWHSIRNKLKWMTWSNFEYIELELTNGSKVIIPSLLIDRKELNSLLVNFELVHKERLIPAIK